VSYHGESSRNIYTRSLEHRSDIRNNNEKSPLVKHGIIDHQGNTPQFKLSVVSHHNTAMERQSAEGVQIILTDAEEHLNSKAEYHQAPMIRVIAVRGISSSLEERSVRRN
jgi:hypothetical protein